MKYFVTFILLIISNLSYSDENNQLLLHKEAKKIPNISLNSFDYKKSQQLSSRNKNLYIINFWATWCPPCVKEIPDLLDLKNKLGEQLDVILISVDSNPTNVIPKFLKKNKIPVQNFFSDQKLDVSKKLNVKVMPTTIIINNKLEEVSRVVGYIDWKDPKVLNFLRELL